MFGAYHISGCMLSETNVSLEGKYGSGLPKRAQADGTARNPLIPLIAY